METPPEIAYSGMEPSDRIREIVNSEVARLESFFGRITACRVSIKGPDRHRGQGGIYHPHVWLSLPDGRHVSVSRNPAADPRHADPALAIRDAFRAARRQLQDEARKLRGDVKDHAGPAIGIVLRTFPAEDYGFLESEEGREIYFHRSAVARDAFDDLAPGDVVEFDEDMGDKGPRARTVRLTGKRSAAAMNGDADDR